MFENKPSNQAALPRRCWDQEMLHSRIQGRALDRDGRNRGGLLGLGSCTPSTPREALFISADPLRGRGGGKGRVWRTFGCLLLHFRQVGIISKHVNEEFPAFVTAAKPFKSVLMRNIARENSTKYIYRND